MVLSDDRRFGVVYEIGWQGEMLPGTGHYIDSRRLIVFRDRFQEGICLGRGRKKEAGAAAGTRRNHAFCGEYQNQTASLLKFNSFVRMSVAAMVIVISERTPS